MTDTKTFDPETRAIAYADEGRGPVVVLLAGDAVSLDDLAGLAHSVATEDFRVVRVAAPIATDATALEQAARDIVDLLDELGIARAWIGGHATGGSIARLVAVGHRDRVDGVLLLGVERPEGEEALPELAEAIPVLVIQGADDEVLPAANGEQLKADAPGLVSVVTVPDAGHRFPVTHVGATSWAIEDYLDWD